METLSNELVARVTELLDDFDLINVHSTSRQLYDGSDASFRKRLCRKVSVEVSPESLAKWDQLLHPGVEYTGVEALVITPSHVPEIMDQDLYRDSRRSRTLSKEKIGELRQLQGQPGYIDALYVQRHLLRSGKFVSSVAAILNHFPNVSRISIAQTPRIKRSRAGARLVRSLYDCGSHVGHIKTATRLIGDLSSRSSDDECKRAAEAFLRYFFIPGGFFQEEQHIEVASTFIEMLSSRSSDDDRRETVKAYGDGHPTGQERSSVSNPGFRATSLFMPGGRQFIRDLVAAAMAISKTCTHEPKNLGLSIGGHGSYETEIAPSDLPFTRRGDVNISDIESLELVLGYLDIRWKTDAATSGRDKTLKARRCLDRFLRCFPAITELTIEGESASLRAIVNVIRIGTLKKIHLGGVYCRAGELAQLVRPGQWHGLEELVLIGFTVDDGEDEDENEAQDEVESDEQEDEVESAASEDEDDEDGLGQHVAGVTFEEAWIRFFAALERLPNLVLIKLDNLSQFEDGMVYFGGSEDGASEGNSREDYTLKRDPGCSWQGRLSAFARTIDVQW